MSINGWTENQTNKTETNWDTENILMVAKLGKGREDGWKGEGEHVQIGGNEIVTGR